MTTDREETIKSADIYLVYCGKLHFFDTVQKGSLSEGHFNTSPAVTYYLRSHSPKKEKIPHVTDPASSRKTLNSLQAGLTKQSDLNTAFCEFKKLNLDVAKDFQNKEQVKPKPSEKPHKTTGSLEVKHHVTKKRKPQNCKFFCPVCKQIFDLRREVNLHVSQKHPTFKYKCRYCGKTYINYASKYKHQNSHSPLKHVCKLCSKKFQFKKKFNSS